MDKTVLFVDDDRELLKLLLNTVEITDFTGYAAESGEEALQLIEKHDIQVAVVDQTMPTIPGIELLRQLKESSPRVIRIIMTGHNDFQFAIDAINQGEVFRFLRKPFQVQQLIGILEEAFSEYQRNKDRDELIQRLEVLQNRPEDEYEREMSKTAFFHLNPEDGRIINANSTAAQLVNLPREKVLKMTLESVLSDIDFKAFWEEIKQGLETYGIALTQIKLNRDGESTHYDITAILSADADDEHTPKRIILVFSPQSQITSAEMNLYNYVRDLETNYALKDKGLQFLYEMSKKVGTTRNFDELVENIFSDLKKIVHFDIAMLSTFQERDTNAYIISDYALSESTESLLKAEIHGQYLSRSSAHYPNISPDIQIHRLMSDKKNGEKKEPKNGITAEINLPLKAPEDQLVGMVYIASYSKASYSGEEIRLLYTFTARIALVLHIINNLFSFRLVKEMAIKDGLTGLYNRRYFDEQITNELNRAKRFHNNVSFLVLDIDHFKEVNDNHGHLNGDQILKELAQIISETARKIDVAVRYGGEEFVIILPETDINGAMVIAERLRKKIENYPFRLINTDSGSPEEIHITVSIGVSQAVPSSNITAQDLIEQGDKAMYTAKKRGRNKVVSFHEIDTVTG